MPDPASNAPRRLISRSVNYPTASIVREYLQAVASHPDAKGAWTLARAQLKHPLMPGTAVGVSDVRQYQEVHAFTV